MSSKPSNKVHLLLIEDDDALAQLIEEYLSLHFFEVSRVASGDAGVRAIREMQPDVVILDMMLPGMNGLDVCRQVRESYSGAILILTASKSGADHVAGLELGADDFVTKPIEPYILLARIRAQLRRLKVERGLGDSDRPACIDLGTLQVDLSSRSVQVHGNEVSLTTMEFEILSMLARNAGSVVKRSDFYRQVIGTEYNGIDRGLDVHMSRIRRKMRQAGFDASRFKSVRAVGYFLAVR